jgi:hypothetical protein
MAFAYPARFGTIDALVSKLVAILSPHCVSRTCFFSQCVANCLGSAGLTSSPSVGFFRAATQAVLPEKS